MKGPVHLLSAEEENEIEQKVEFEIAKSHYNMIKLGSMTNVIAGLFVIFILVGQAPFWLLISWYSALFAISLIDVGWAVIFQKKINQPKVLRKWRNGFYVIFGLLSLVWGSIGILFYSSDVHYQIYLVAFLLAVLVGFSFSSITDFTISMICIACLLIPTVIFRFYQGMTSIASVGTDTGLNIGICLCLTIMGLFLLVVCYIGSKLTKRFFNLSFSNVTLSNKLEGMNKLLEHKVKERTIQLEDSLKLVTYQSTHDLLTDLPNQRLLIEYMEAAITKAQSQGKMFYVIFFSINELEKINDGIGHHVGDFVIQTIARHFKDEYGKGEIKVTLSRKDVFVLISEPYDEGYEIENDIEKVFNMVSEPIYSENQVLKLTASLGVSIYPLNGHDVPTLLMNADAAMLDANKKGGNSIKMYTDEINANISKQLELEGSMHAALNNNEFYLQYQPLVDVKTGRICGAEALLRWKNPILGMISPAHFIPLAEANGIILPLGEWVLRTACFEAKKWQDAGLKNLRVAVNLSAKQIQQKNLVSTIAAILQESKLDPSLLELELTESVAFQEESLNVLKKFTSMGVSLTIDDFGTGYSGLTNLKLLDIDKIKIDKLFIQDVHTNDNSRTIVSNTIALAKELNISVLAEGVETQEQLLFLQAQGCDYIQGFYFSTAVNADIFIKLLIDQPYYSM
jgi:diguanylate cyclase (GGDEF)-like protein